MNFNLEKFNLFETGNERELVIQEFHSKTV